MWLGWLAMNEMDENQHAATLCDETIADETATTTMTTTRNIPFTSCFVGRYEHWTTWWIYCSRRAVDDVVGSRSASLTSSSCHYLSYGWWCYFSVWLVGVDAGEHLLRKSAENHFELCSVSRMFFGWALTRVKAGKRRLTCLEWKYWRYVSCRFLLIATIHQFR